MQNRYPLWKYLLIFTVAVLGFIYSAPNLYAPDPAVQVSGESSTMDIDEKVLAQIEAALGAAGIDYFGATSSGTSALIRLRNGDQQMLAKREIQQVLGNNYVVALSMASTTPAWLRAFGAEPMKLGLDLSGGVHFLMEVDTASAVARRQETNAEEMKDKLRRAKIRYSAIIANSDNILMARFRTQELRDEALSSLRRDYDDLMFSTRNPTSDSGEFTFQAELSEAAVREIENYALSQNLVTLRNRINELGVSEPIVQRQGRNRIIVQLPGVQDTAEAKRIIGKTANLEFRLEATSDALVSAKEQFPFRNEQDQRRYGDAFLERQLILTGDHVANATSSFDPETNMPQVNITLDSVGGARMHRATRNSVGRRMGVLFIEYRTIMESRVDASGEQVEVPVQYVEKKIISLATIQSALGVQFRITGAESSAEASELALLLRAGALAAPMYFVEERTIGPSLGAENIKMGIASVQWAMALILLFLLFYYRMFGVFASIALTVNLLLLVAAMSLIGSTLTMPGIAGIVLALGMAIDSNVLIFSRIREELSDGAPPQAAIYNGYERAWGTILDANVTTLLVAVILYAIGTGPVQGFAVTLSLGILISMFTAILGTRALANLVYGRNKSLKKLWI